MASLGKRLVVVMALTMAISVVAASSALASEAKTEAVSLSSTVSGDTATFRAVTLKDGSEFSDSWEGATKVETVLRADGYYVSTATFSAAGLAAGTYSVSYHITMSAGTSEVIWEGGAADTVTVSPDPNMPPRPGGSGPNI